MQAVSFPGYGRTEIIEVPRPALREPGDAIVLVTTAAIGPWDIERFQSVGDSRAIPGGEFAGIVVETGEDVTAVQLDDLVANTVYHQGPNGSRGLFGGSNALPGGHAEYVRVPDANSTLCKIAASGEERAVIAGGTVGLGVSTAASMIARFPLGTFAVVGCDPIGMSALIALKAAGASDRLIAVENHPARKTLASNYASSVFSSSENVSSHKVDVVIVGSIREYPGFESVIQLVKPGGQIVFSEPYGSERVMDSGVVFPEGVTTTAAKWPTNKEAMKIATAIQIRRLDLTPLVSHVFPLDEVQDAYESASEPRPGVQKVLLKP